MEQKQVLQLAECNRIRTCVLRRCLSSASSAGLLKCSQNPRPLDRTWQSHFDSSSKAVSNLRSLRGYIEHVESPVQGVLVRCSLMMKAWQKFRSSDRVLGDAENAGPEA